jgi:transcription elongation factor GreA
MSKYFLTQEALEKAREELKYFKETKQREISELLKEAISHGDLKENAAYHDAKDRQMLLQMKMAELNDKIRNAEIIKSQTILVSLNGREQKIELGGKISLDSPIGRAISGKKPGEEVEFEVNGKKNKVKIIKILK